MTGTFRSQVRPGSPAASRRQSSSSASSTTSGASALGELERLAPARGAEHVEAVVAQLPAEVLARLGLGLGDEDGARHAPTLARRRGSARCPFGRIREKPSSAVQPRHGPAS